MPARPTDSGPENLSSLTEQDYYFEGEYMVFTAAFHRKRGYCCGSGCRHCPFGNGAIEEDAGQSPEPDEAAATG